MHNGSVFHPAAVVFPPALAVAQAIGASGRELLTASVAGYEVGIRIGEFLGQAHYKVFHTTGTAGSLAAAAAVGRLLGLSPDQMLDAFGSAGTQAAGLWEFLRDGADSKPLHTAHAAVDGSVLRLSCARRLHRGEANSDRSAGHGGRHVQGRRPSPSRRPAWRALGARGDVVQIPRLLPAYPSRGGRASARHAGRRLKPDDVASVTARVHQAAIDVLGPVADPQTVHQAKFSMGSVLGLAATRGSAGMSDFERFFEAPETMDFARKVTMAFDPEVEAAYPARWIGKVEVETIDGRRLAGRVDEPKGDPGNTLSRAELEAKALGLAEFSHSATPEEMSRWFPCSSGSAERTLRRGFSAEPRARRGLSDAKGAFRINKWKRGKGRLSFVIGEKGSGCDRSGRRRRFVGFRLVSKKTVLAASFWDGVVNREESMDLIKRIACDSALGSRRRLRRFCHRRSRRGLDELPPEIQAQLYNKDRSTRSSRSVRAPIATGSRRRGRPGRSATRVPTPAIPGAQRRSSTSRRTSSPNGRSSVSSRT